MTSVADSLIAGAAILRDAAVPDAVQQASSLLRFAIARDRAFLIAHPEYELTESEADLFRRAIGRRAEREPFQHIVGQQEFYGFDFLVSPDVLIPRPETELIVERAIELLIGKPSPRFLEIGVGSGCISVAILKHCPKAAATAVDISEPAIAIARRNAEMHDVSGRLQLLPSDVFENVPDEKFDLIVSNPPYVPLAEYEELQPEVREHDPKIAVTDGSTGLTMIERIIHEAPNYLNPAGHLVIEIGCGHDKQVGAIFNSSIWKKHRIIPDLQRIPRTVEAQLG